MSLLGEKLLFVWPQLLGTLEAVEGTVMHKLWGFPLVPQIKQAFSVLFSTLKKLLFELKWLCNSLPDGLSATVARKGLCLASSQYKGVGLSGLGHL